MDPYSNTTTSSMGRQRLSREFDPIFEKYRGAIPLEFLRALAERESGMNSSERSGPAWGLLQIVEVVRHEYNRANQTHYTREHLLDPSVNVAIACWLLRRILESYQKHHADVPNLRPDWNNPRFVELLVFGWNAGYSEVGGVGKVARYLKALGIEITVDSIYQHATSARASRFLASGDRFRWCKSVVALYLSELAASGHRDASWWSIKTPSVILDEMRAAKSEVEALGRDIYATFRRPFEAQLAGAEERFFKTYGRKPGVGRQADPNDFPTVHAWMVPVPSAADLENMSYQGQFVRQWGEFEREVGDFVAAHSGSWSERLWRGTYDKAVEYRERAGEWRKKFEALGGRPTTPAPKPPTEDFLPPGLAIPWKGIAVVGGLVAGALLVPAAVRVTRR